MSYIQKYNLKSRGLNLEKTDPLKAIDYYRDLITHEYFINDYYPYRRLVLMYEKTRNTTEKVMIIRDFFKSRRYCNEYNYLWFKYKLEKDYSNTSEIIELTDEFKNKSLPNKNLSNTPLPVADRIRKKGNVTVESAESYNRRQKQYAYELRASRLYSDKKYREYIDLVNYMIDELGYATKDNYKRLCNGYRKIKDRESESEAIEKYLQSNLRHTKKNDWWFKKRLEELKQDDITFKIDEFDLSRNLFFEYMKKLDLVENLKRKAVMIEYGKGLEGPDAVSYYKYLSNNSYFSNDWYPYRRLSEVYDELGDYNAGLVNIKKLLQSKIYLNEYHFLYFTEKIRQLMDKCDVDESAVERWIDDYEINGSVNRFNLNKFLADRFIFENDIVRIENEDDFSHEQEKLALMEKGLVYERVENFELAVTHYIRCINSEEFNYLCFHERAFECLCKIKDYKRARKACELYFKTPPCDRTDESDDKFKKHLERIKVNS